MFKLILIVILTFLTNNAIADPGVPHDPNMPTEAPHSMLEIKFIESGYILSWMKSESIIALNTRALCKVGTQRRIKVADTIETSVKVSKKLNYGDRLNCFIYTPQSILRPNKLVTKKTFYGMYDLAEEPHEEEEPHEDADEEAKLILKQCKLACDSN